MPDDNENRFEAVAVGAEGYKTFLYYYRFKDHEWAFKIQALDEQEAEERVRSLSLYGRLQGEEIFSISAPRGFGWLAMIIVRVRNWIFG